LPFFREAEKGPLIEDQPRKARKSRKILISFPFVLFVCFVVASDFEVSRPLRGDSVMATKTAKDFQIDRRVAIAMDAMTASQKAALNAVLCSKERFLAHAAGPGRSRKPSGTKGAGLRIDDGVRLSSSFSIARGSTGHDSFTRTPEALGLHRPAGRRFLVVERSQ
jgi:hypothetical protein